jgi:hypothetical protein
VQIHLVMKNQIIITVALALLAVCLPQVNAEPPSTQIASAVERGGFVYLYNEKGNQIGCVQGGSGPKGGLMGFTGSSVSVRRGGFVYIYDAKGHQTGCVGAGN